MRIWGKISEMLSILIVVVVLWLYTTVKTHQFVHFKWMWFIVHELFLILVDMRKVLFLIEKNLDNGKVQVVAMVLKCNAGEGH